MLAAFAGEEGLSSSIDELNRRRIQTDLWLNLPSEDGYWQSKANVATTRRQVGRLLEWIRRRNLKIRSVGLDVEPDIRVMKLMVHPRPLKLIAELARTPRPKDAQSQFEATVREINEELGVSIYKIPIIGDYGIARKLFSLFDVPEDFLADSRNDLVSMLYSSFAPISPARFVERFIIEGETPAVGVVSAHDEDPGVDFGDEEISRVRTPLLGARRLASDVSQVRSIYTAESSTSKTGARRKSLSGAPTG